MARVGSCFEPLPSEAFTAITDFIFGSELLHFSHVNAALLNDLLAPNSALWRQRLSKGDLEDDVISPKQRYFTSRSFRFPGTVVDGRGEAASGGSVKLPPGMNARLVGSSFSVELQFALQPSQKEGPEVYAGGIILGAQSGEWRSRQWEATYEQLIHVDPHGNLYCTVTNTKDIVAEHLEMQRWYHLVLVYARSDIQDEPGSRVYLNGQLIHCSVGALHRDWQQLHHMQLGSAWFSRGSKGKPTDSFNCWYGFCGVLDSFSIWPRAFSVEEIQERMNEDPLTKREAQDGVVWSLQQADASCFSQVRRVQCSRPAEGYCYGTTTGTEVTAIP